MQALWGLGSDRTNEHPAPSHHACSVSRYAGFVLSGSVYSPVPHHPLLNSAVRRERLPPSCDCVSRLPSLSLEDFTNSDRDTFRKRYLLPHAFSGWELKLQHCQRCPQMRGVLLEANLAWIWSNYVCWKSINIFNPLHFKECNYSNSLWARVFKLTGELLRLASSCS